MKPDLESLLEAPKSAINDIFAGNQFFAGGLGLAALGVGASFLRRGSSVAQAVLRRQLLVTLEVTSKDPSYPWVLNWLNSHGRRTQHLSVNTSHLRACDGSSTTQFEFVPGPGRHVIWYGGRAFLVERVREQQMVNMNTGAPWERVLLTSVGRDPEVFAGLLREAQSLSTHQQEGTTVVYTSWGTEWRPFGHPRRKRPISSVVLPAGVSERLVADIQEWRASAAWYHARGIPYRRGFLLHGPPGCGKTSFILALAGHLDMGICILSLSEEGLSDDRLAQAMSVVPQRSIVLLEDIDAAFVRRDTGEFHRRASVTLSGLLNTLDGVASSEERIIFMTTNFLDRLDPALIRPGRIDVVTHIGSVDAEQLRRLFLNFYPQVEVADSLPARFSDAVCELAIRPSPAHVQGYLLGYKHDPAAAVANVHELAARVSESDAQANAPEREAVAETGSELRRPRGRRVLTADEVDRMPFNPQAGWEEASGLK